MTFLSSYYANIKNIPNEYKLVSISGDIPEYIENQVDIHDKRLAPNWSLFKEYKDSPEGTKREKRYIQRFKEEVLTKYLITDILKDWSDKCGLLETYVILCYESNDINKSTFCHRRIVAEFIENKFNIKVNELDFDYDTYKIEDYKVKLKNEINEDEW